MPTPVSKCTDTSLIEVRLRHKCYAEMRSLTLQQDAIYPTNSFDFLKNVHGEIRFHETISYRTKTSKESKPLKLNVLIVGAGLGGLATAVALRLHGHQVTVLEQAPALAEVSAYWNQISLRFIFPGSTY